MNVTKIDSKMKYVTTTFTVLALLFSITACAGDRNKKGNTPDTTNSDTQMINLTKAGFLKDVYNFETSPKEWKYEGDKPCIVDFYATWCGPCKAMAPILEKLAKEYKGKIYIYKVDVDKEPELSGAFGIGSVPTLLWVPQTGKPVFTQGGMPEKELRKRIDETLLNLK